MAAKKADADTVSENVTTLANIDEAETVEDRGEPVTLTMPAGTVVHARPEVAERLVANGAVAPKAKRKTAADKED